MIGPYGDRHQSLVFIGHAIDQDRITELLDRCLVTDDEFVKGPEVWAGFKDPFPPIELQTDRVANRSRKFDGAA